MSAPQPPAVSVLGAVAITVGGARAEPRGRRSRELLARLVAARGQVVSADRLIDDLWGDDAPRTALNSLQVHVSHLRRALEPERRPGHPPSVVVSAVPGYALHLPVNAVDLWRFEQLTARADERPVDDAAGRRELLAAALACWSGPAFAEFSGAAWTHPERSRLDQLRRAATEAAAAADLALGRLARAVDALEELLREDETREETARLLALALYRSGRQADGLAVLRRLRRHLADELGVDPDPRVRALEADILAHAPTLDEGTVSSAVPIAAPRTATPPRAASDAVPADRPRALGREAERETVAQAAEAATRMGVRVVWVAGEAGDGKTTLVRDMAEALRGSGWTTVWGRCPEVEGAPPGWAWREIGETIGLDLARLSGGDVDGAGINPFLVAHEIGDAVRAGTPSAPCLIVLEDAHRADDLTAQLLRQVLDTLAEVPALVLVTYRGSEATPQLVAARAAAAAVTADHLQLAGLGRAAVAELSRSVGFDPDHGTLDLLVERTGGNPLFVRELARLLAARGRREAATAVPLGVADVLRARASRLPPASVTALRQAAVLGREVDLDVLAAVTGGDADEIQEALEPPVLSGLLHHDGPNCVRFDHAIVRDTFYADTPPLRRTRWHARAVTVLAQRAPDAVDALAYHAVQSLRPDTADLALRWTRAAAERALRAGAPAQAAELYRQALRAAAMSTTTTVTGAVQLRAAAVRACAQAADAVGGRALQREAVELAGDDETLLALALSAWDAPLIWSVRSSSTADDTMVGGIRRLLARQQTDATRARLLCALFLETENLDNVTALDCSEQALALARHGGDDRLLCAALNLRAYAALGPDLADRRQQLAEELVAVATRSGHADYEAAGHWLVFLTRAGRGDLVAAQRAVDRAVELAASGQLFGLLGVLNIWRAVLHILAGRIAEGLQQYATISNALAEGGGANADVMELVGRVVVGFAAGDLSALADDLAAVGGGPVEVIRALALLDAGRADEARAAYDGAPPVDRGYYWLGLTTARAHAATRLGVVDDVPGLYAELLPWSGRIAGLDSGTMPLGPVDDALARCAELLGDEAAAAGHRQRSADVLVDLARELAAVGIAPTPTEP